MGFSTWLMTALIFVIINLWFNYENLWSNKPLFGQWVSSNSQKIALSGRSPTNFISHLVDLEKLVRHKLLLENNTENSKVPTIVSLVVTALFHVTILLCLIHLSLCFCFCILNWKYTIKYFTIKWSSIYIGNTS